MLRHTRSQRPFMRVKALKGRKQRRVDVDHPPFPFVDQPGVMIRM